MFAFLFLAILLLNCVFYAVFNLYGTEAQVLHFAASRDALVHHRYYVLVTSMFLHAGLLHFLVNMLSYASLYVFLRKIFGARPYRFILFCLTTGILTALLHCMVSTVPAVGFSGVLFGLLAIISFYSPFTKLYVFFVIPIPAKIAILSLTVFSLLAYTYDWLPTWGHLIHASGAVLGIIYFYLFIRSCEVIPPSEEPSELQARINLVRARQRQNAERFMSRLFGLPWVLVSTLLQLDLLTKAQDHYVSYLWLFLTLLLLTLPQLNYLAGGILLILTFHSSLPNYTLEICMILAIPSALVILYFSPYYRHKQLPDSSDFNTSLDKS